MNDLRSTTEFLLAQCSAYPALRPQDLLKALHQSVFGCGHFVTDEAAGLRLIQKELASLPAEDSISAPEMLDRLKIPSSSAKFSPTYWMQ